MSEQTQIPDRALVCPPQQQPITDEEIGWVVVTLYRNGMGVVEARSVHLRDEGEGHEVATLLATYGPTWLLGVGFEDFGIHRYGKDNDA